MSTAAVLARYGKLEDIPLPAGQWDVPGLRGAAQARAHPGDAPRAGATSSAASPPSRRDVPVGTVDDWRWQGPTAEFGAVCAELGDERLPGFAARVASTHAQA